MENSIELTNKAKNKRIIELDMVKGLIIASVMLKHINLFLGLSASNPLLDYAFAWMFEIFMVAFFVISGYVYSPKGSVGSQIVKRIKQLLIPLLIYCCFDAALYFIRYVLIEHVSLTWFFQKIALCFLGFSNSSFFCPLSSGPNDLIMGYSPYWFIFQMLPASIIFILVKALGDKKGFTFRCIFAAVLMLICIVIYHYDFQHTIRDALTSQVPFYLVLINVFGFAGVMMIGSLLKEKNVYDINHLPKNYSLAAFILSAAIMTIISSNYNPDNYTLLYGRWGQYGTMSVIVTTIGGIILTYFLVYIQHYLKRIKPLEKVLVFLGQNSLTYLLLHTMICETLCYIGGFWYPVYSAPYPVENFSYTRWIVVLLLTLTICTGYILLKNFIKANIKKKKTKMS